MLPDWSGKTVVCIASGPSLTPEDCAAVKLSGHPTIVTNTTFRLCNWAHALFGFDPVWWQMHIDEIRAVFSGLLFGKSPRVSNLGVDWAERYPEFRSFGTSGGCAISLAIAAGSRNVVMLGYDNQFTNGQSHHHGDHPEGLNNCASMYMWAPQFGRLASWAKYKQARVVNASRVTKLECFDRMPLESCL